jgi:RNA polymerase sigma-70 factor (ECF subfamily)
VETSRPDCQVKYAKIPALPWQPPPTADATRADVALLDRILAHDPNALAELYDRHGRLVFCLVLRILRDRDEAEDVVQEVFVQAWTRAGTYDAALGTPAGWLVGIARNRAIDRLRASTRRGHGTNIAAALPPRLPEQGSGGAQQLDIQRALDALPPEQRNLIEEAFFLGFTHSELAQRHDLPLGTVKTRIRNGMHALRGYLEGRYIEQ